jgi:dienelactone hydrolase
MHRHSLPILAWMSLTALTIAADVPWLAEVTQPPGDVPAPFRPLAPLLSDDDRKAPDALTRWNARRTELREAWLKFLGPMPARPKATAFDVLRTDELEGLTRKLIRYENESGRTIEAYLLQPTGKPGRRRAGLVALHATTPETIEPIAGVKGNDAEQLGLKLARRGFVVICPKNFLWHDVANYSEAVDRFKMAHPKALGMHKMLYDAQRATDILAALPDVDSKRLGTLGHSLGAKEVLYLMAFDERIQAGVFSEGGIAFDSTNWEAPWYLGAEIQKGDFSRNHHELLALIAPRPFLVLAGESGRGAADGDRSWPYLAAAQPIYALYGGPPRLGLLNHRQGHSIPPDVFLRMAEWLETYLAAGP